MEYVKRITDYGIPTKKDTLPYNTLWVCKHSDGLNELFIQKNKNHHRPSWQNLGYEITQQIEQFWADEDSFIKQAQFLFGLDDQEVEELKARMPHNH